MSYVGGAARGVELTAPPFPACSRTVQGKEAEETPPRTQDLPSNVQSPQTQGLVSHAPDLQIAGPQTATAGRAEASPSPPRPGEEGAKAPGREGTHVYKQGGGSARESAPGDGGEGSQITRSLVRLSVR